MTPEREQLVVALADAFGVEPCDVVVALHAIDERRASTEAQRLLYIEQCVEPVYRLWLAQAQAAGLIPDVDPGVVRWA